MTLFLRQQIQYQMTNCSQVFSCITLSNPALVFVESDIQYPVQLILNTLMVARGLENLGGLGG